MKQYLFMEKNQERKRSESLREKKKPPIAPKPAKIINGRIVMIKDLIVEKNNVGRVVSQELATSLSTLPKDRSESDSEAEAEIISKLECVTEECVNFIKSVLRALTYLMLFKDSLFPEFQSKQDINAYLTSAFREIQPLKMMYEMMMEKINELFRCSTNGTLCLWELFLDTGVRATLKIYKVFLQQYSVNAKWIGEFIRTNTQCQDICRQVKEKHQIDETFTLESCFYTIFSSLFSLELIINRYISCFEEGDLSHTKGKEVKSVLSDLLGVINTNLDQEQFFLTHKELNLIIGRTRETKITTRFIHKGEATKISRRDDKPLSRLLVLFSDCLYVTLLPKNISGTCSARQELSLDSMVVSVVPDDEDRGINLRWGLNIHAREAYQDFYFEDEATLNTWKAKLQSAIGNEANQCEDKSFVRPRIGDEAPRWQKDSAARYCNGHKCNQIFSHTIRRHHCRADGLLYCDACCYQKVKLKFERTPESRVCDLCFRILLGDLNRPDELEDAKKQLDLVFEKKTRKGKKCDWLIEQVYNRERNAFGPGTKYFCELDLTDPFLKMYERPEDKCKQHGIMLLGMTISIKKESKRCKKMKPNQFMIEHQDKDEAYLFDALNPENCHGWVNCLRESINDYCNQ